ncbi:SDR family oxidoreductase [Piscibacillus salipiscarius]
MMDRAEEEINNIIDEKQISPNLIHVVPGDITKPNLDMDITYQELFINNIHYVFHLAAIYALAVPKSIAFNVNVRGTQQVNEWVKTLNHLKRYVYFSTAYVSGKRTGKILETELDCRQEFKNHYEQTKFEAEVLVDQLKVNIPTTIIRPGVVCGHSKTGETIKFDGPYFMLNLMDALKTFPIPYIGKSDAYGNFVPVDYIFESTIYLAHATKGEGKTYHLADPNPYRMREVYSMLMQEFLGKMPKWTTPLTLARLSLSLSVTRKWLRVEKESLDYSRLLAEHDCSQAVQDLKGSGISCPDFKEVVPAIVQFYREHKNHPQYQIKID